MIAARTIAQTCWLLTATFALPTLCACSIGKDPNAPARQTAELRMSDGAAAMQRKDYEGAVVAYQAALAMKMLQADAYEVALVQSSVALARLKRYDEALANLDEAAKGAAAMHDVHAARAFVYKCKGENGKAQQEIAKAKAISPSVKLIQ